VQFLEITALGNIGLYKLNFNLDCITNLQGKWGIPPLMALTELTHSNGRFRI